MTRLGRCKNSSTVWGKVFALLCVILTTTGAFLVLCLLHGEPSWQHGTDEAFDLKEYKNESLLDVLEYSQSGCACKRFGQYMRASSDAGLSKKIAFVHIPKTGGTTIEKHLLQHPSRNSLRSLRMKLVGSCHATAAQMKKCHPHDFEEALTFAALRYPVDRTISMYHYARGGGNRGLKDRIKFKWVKGLTFLDFLQRLWEHKDYNLAPQSHFVLSADNELIVDKILCSERLNQDFKEFSRDVQGLNELPFKRLRTSSSSNSSSPILVGEEIVGKLKVMFPDDFYLWGEFCSTNIIDDG